MAAECAVLGVPAVYCSSRRLWYTTLLEKRGLLSHVGTSAEALTAARRWKRLSRERLLARRDAYLEEVGDPVDRWVDTIENARLQPPFQNWIGLIQMPLIPHSPL